MPRDVDERKKRKALRQLRKAAALAEAGLGPPLSDWEREFLEEVETRIETYGSAFADPTKGDLEEPLSSLQARKLKEIDKKARGKATGFKPRKGLGHKTKPGFAPRGRDINDDMDDSAVPEPEVPAKPAAPKLVTDAPAKPPEPRPAAEPPEPVRPVFRVIKGGLED